MEIHYTSKSVYGVWREYVTNEEQAKLIANLTRQKTIDSAVRVTLEKLTRGYIKFVYVSA